MFVKKLIEKQYKTDKKIEDKEARKEAKRRLKEAEATKGKQKEPSTPPPS